MIQNKLEAQNYYCQSVLEGICTSTLLENEFQLQNNKYCIIYMIYNTLILCIWPAIASAPGGHTNLRPVSLEPVWPEGCHQGKNFLKSDQWPNHQRKKLGH